MSRRWLGWLAVALLAAAVCVFLGRWQYNRYDHKITASNHLEHNYNGTPVALATAQPDPSAVPDTAQEWKQVRFSGQYLAADRVLIRNRPLDKTYGYEVVVPFRTSTGDIVFVDRGWIPNGKTAVGPDSVPPTPSGTVEVTGWLRAGEPDLKRAEVPGQAASINIALLRELSHHPEARNAYVLRRAESGSGVPQSIPSDLPKPDTGSYAWINFSYALQWWGGAIAVLAFFVVRLRREHLEATGRPKAPRQKRTRIWDEEDD